MDRTFPICWVPLSALVRNRRQQCKGYRYFQWATENGYIVYTHDLDFGAILAATNARFPSVIQLRHQSFFPDAQEDVQRVTTYLKQYQDLLVAGALLTIDEQKAKIRVLPIH